VATRARYLLLPLHLGKLANYSLAFAMQYNGPSRLERGVVAPLDKFLPAVGTDLGGRTAGRYS